MIYRFLGFVACFGIAIAVNCIPVIVLAWAFDLTLWQSAVVLLFLWASAGHAKELRRRK